LANVASLPCQDWLHHDQVAASFHHRRRVVVAGGCSPPLHPINPPSASIQQLDVLPDGRWKVQIRIENFSDKTVHYSTFKAALRMSGLAAADISLTPEIDIPGINADIIETTMAPSADLSKAFASDIRQPGGAPYELNGTIGIRKRERIQVRAQEPAVASAGNSESVSVKQGRRTRGEGKKNL
jgi:hypothetical protein